ncbi:MAG TPA: class I SAM-dependent methyltransferase [Candidatus Sulfopaludibacter sp.]|jgi:2-polyprenyl-3-methyl-5-hydroxy-6-metoxy-1,4-benzoquinol methylase|nr:class I SAM-dependent methyltransferase [Candidatus Sulfopaludibacter sp.]
MPLPGPLKNMFRGSKGNQPPQGQAVPVSARSSFPKRHSGDEITSTRNSRGLEEFFSQIRDQSGLTILDLGGATQQNVTFITNLGHRLYSEDFLQILNETFGPEDTVDQANPGRIEYFLRQALDYPEGQFDGVLIWDVLEYLEPALLNAVVERLQKIVRPKSYMLSFFHSDDKLDAVPFYTFRIQETNSLHVAERGLHRPVQLFNNRSLEKLFGRFGSVKFFLTRERLREVIIKV